MSGSMIELFNRNIPGKVNKNDELYLAWFGNEVFTPEIVIVESADYNCGALANELEFCGTVSEYIYDSFWLDIASSTELDMLIDAFLNLPRRGAFEADAIYRSRFKFIVQEWMNTRRTTKWAIRDALHHFISDISKIKVLEFFDTYNLYFQVRMSGVESFDLALFLNNDTYGYLNNEFVSGVGIGSISTYAKDLVDRIKAAGVRCDMYFTGTALLTKTSDATIGAVQKYYTMKGHIKAAVSFTKLSDATIV